MPNIKKIQLNSQDIIGVQTRTTNKNESVASTQKIAPLWDKFHHEIFPKLKENSTFYAVYYNYESDAQGAFNVLIGSNILEMSEKNSTVNLLEGRYLIFPVKGEFPIAIIKAWNKIWAYFEDESIDERRSYETDFEKYISINEAEIYIGVNYL